VYALNYKHVLTYYDDKSLFWQPQEKEETRSTVGGIFTLLSLPLILIYTIIFIMSFAGNNGKGMPQSTSTELWPSDGSDRVKLSMKCIASEGCWVRPMAGAWVPNSGSMCHWFDQGETITASLSQLYADPDPISTLSVSGYA